MYETLGEEEEFMPVRMLSSIARHGHSWSMRDGRDDMPGDEKFRPVSGSGRRKAKDNYSDQACRDWSSPTKERIRCGSTAVGGLVCGRVDAHQRPMTVSIAEIRSSIPRIAKRRARSPAADTESPSLKAELWFQDMDDGPAVKVEIGAAGRNWERPPPPPLDPHAEALGKTALSLTAD